MEQTVNVKSVNVNTSENLVSKVLTAAVLNKNDLDGLEYITENIFARSQYLVKFEAPDTLKEIGAYAFMYCPNLQKVILNKGIETIRSGAFYGMDIIYYSGTLEELERVKCYSIFGGLGGDIQCIDGIHHTA